MSEQNKNFREMVSGFKIEPTGGAAQTLVSKAIGCLKNEPILDGVDSWLQDNGIAIGDIKEFNRGNRSVLFEITKNGKPTGELLRVAVYIDKNSPQYKKLKTVIQAEDNQYGKDDGDKIIDGKEANYDSFSHIATDPDYPLQLPARQKFKQTTEYGDFEVAIVPKLKHTNDKNHVEQLDKVSSSNGWELYGESKDLRQITVITKPPASGWKNLIKRISHQIDLLLGTAEGLPILIDGHVRKNGNAAKWPDTIHAFIQPSASLSPAYLDWSAEDVATLIPSFPFTKTTDEKSEESYECGSIKFNKNGKALGETNERTTKLEQMLSERIRSGAFEYHPLKISENSYGGGVWDFVGNILNSNMLKPVTEAFATSWILLKNIANGVSGGTNPSEKVYEYIKKYIAETPVLKDFEIVRPTIDLGFSFAIEYKGKAETINHDEVKAAIDKLNQEIGKETQQKIGWPWKLFIPSGIIAILPEPKPKNSTTKTDSPFIDGLVAACKIEDDKSKNVLKKAGATIADGLLKMMGLGAIKDHDFVLAKATSGQNAGIAK